EVSAVSAVTAGVPTAVTTPAARETATLGPAEFSRDLLERCRHGRVLLGRDGTGHARADLVHGDAETLFRQRAGLSQSPALVSVLDPAELEEAVQLVLAERTVGSRRPGKGAVDAVQHPPVATGDALVLEDGGELGSQQAVDRRDPV